MKQRAAELQGNQREPNPAAIPYEDFARKYLSGLFGKPWSLLHRRFADDFDRMRIERGSRICYVAPRSGGKSKHLCVGYPLYCICYDLEPFILLCGSSAELPEGHLAIIKNELETNLLIRADFPHAFGRGSVWNVKKIVTNNGIAVRTVGRGGKVRGAGHGAHRPTLILGDDIDDDDSVASPDAKKKCREWLGGTIVPLGVLDQVNVLIAGTVLDPEDLTQTLRNTPGWLYRHYKSLITFPDEESGLWQEWRSILRDETVRKRDGLLAENEQPARDFYKQHEKPMNAGAVLLWPEQESLYALQMYREEWGEKLFATEKQGDATRTGSNEWSPELFDLDTVGFDRWPYCHIRGQTCDPSKGRTDKSDYSFWVYGGFGPDGNLYVDADGERRDAWQICVDGVEIAQNFKPHSLAMEEDAYGAISKLWGKAVEEAGFIVPDLRTINHQKAAKPVRIRRLTEWFRKYRIRFKRNSPGVALLLQQLKQFPNGKHDDGPDALEMLVRLLCFLLDSRAAVDRGETDDAAEDFRVETLGGV